MNVHVVNRRPRDNVPGFFFWREPNSWMSAFGRLPSLAEQSPTRRYLDTAEAQAEYMTAALETGDVEFIRDAVGVVARARGMTKIAKETGLSRESLYKALGESGNPEFGTVMRIVRALGLTLAARPAATARTRKKRRAA
jgi:probable addiction module antidote protein